MKHAFALIPVLALAATAAIAANATSEVSLPALPAAPVIPPAKPASPPNKAAPAKPNQPKAKAPAPRPQPKSTEIDLSSSKVLSAETEDGKPVYVVFQNDSPKSVLFADNDRGGWIGNTYVRIGGGVVDQLGSKDATMEKCSGSYIDFDASVSLTSWLSARIIGLSFMGVTVKGDGGKWDETVRCGDDSDFQYSSFNPMLVVSVNRNGIINPYAGLGCIIQSATIKNCEWRENPYSSPARYASGDIDGDCSFLSPAIGLEINAQRFHLTGECIFNGGEKRDKLNPFGFPSEPHEQVLYGGRISMGFSVSDNFSVFGNATMTHAFRIFGAGIGWRF